MYSAARYQAHKYQIHNTAVDLTGAPADILAIPVIWPAVELIYLGIAAQAAFSNSATMTTLPVVSLDKIHAGVRTELGTVSPAYSQADNAVAQTDLNANASNTALPADYPFAVQGDELIIEHKTAGVGGTQSAKPYFIFREIEAEDAV